MLTWAVVRRTAGFTLLELMAVMAIIALLVTLVAPKYFSTVTRAQETALKSNLAQMRDAIDKFYADQGRYPSSLNELVTRRYLRTIPLDPLTQRADTWVAIAPTGGQGGQVVDVKSGFKGRVSDGTTVETW